MAEQLFHRGDLVQFVPYSEETIEDSIPASENVPATPCTIIVGHGSREYQGLEAIIEYSYSERYGGISEFSKNSYSVLFKESGSSVSWFEPSHFTKIGHVGEDGILAVKNRAKIVEKEQSDFAWILAAWKERDGKLPGNSLFALMHHIGIDDPWGKHGEGVVLYANFRLAVRVCREALDAGSLDALLALKDAVKGSAYDLTRPIGLDADMYASKHGDGVAEIKRGAKSLS